MSTQQISIYVLSLSFAAC